VGRMPKLPDIDPEFIVICTSAWMNERGPSSRRYRAQRGGRVMGLVIINTLAIRAENVDRITRNAFGRTEVHMRGGQSYIFDLPLAEVVATVNAADSAGRVITKEPSHD